jgi:hypothetical protein
MKQIVDLVQRARVTCRHITPDDFVDSILPIGVTLIALSLTVGLAIPIIRNL